MLEYARCSPGRNVTISETDTSRTSGTSTRRSAIQRRRKLGLLCRSENWMGVLQRATGKPVGSVLIQNSLWQTSWSSWYSTSSDKWWFLGRISRNSTGCVDKTPTHRTHLCNTVCSQSAPHNDCAWLGSSSRPSVICKHLCAPK